MNKIEKYEYLYLQCIKCNDRVKLAKNKGASWKEFETNLSYFLMNHSECDVKKIKIEFTDT